MSEFDLMGIDPEDFPELPTVEYQNSITLPQQTLRSMISQTIFAVSDDESRPNPHRQPLRGGRGGAHHGGGGRFPPGPPQGAYFGKERKLRVRRPWGLPQRGGKICRETDDPVDVHQGARHVLFKMGDTILIARRLEGEFLAWRQAIPRNNPIKVTVETKQLLSCIERVSLIVSEKLKSPLRCVMGEGEIHITTRTAIGNAQDRCPMEGSGNGLEIGFNNRYMMEALRPPPGKK